MPLFLVTFVVWLAAQGRLQLYYDLASKPAKAAARKTTKGDVTKSLDDGLKIIGDVLKGL